MTKIINSLRKCFTQIPNAIVIDALLSDGALRVFLYMSTKPDDWQFNNRDIQNKLNIKRAETIAKYWKELIQSGWISRQPIINENGKPTGYFNYVLNFEPQIPTPQNAEVVPTTDKPYTVNQQLRKNRSYSNKEIGTNNKNTNTPISHQSVPQKSTSGDFGVCEIITNLNLNFSELELQSIHTWFSYAAQKSRSKSIPSAQVSALLHILHEHKSNGYDISGMITRSIGNGYTGVMTPTKDFLIAGNSKPIVSGKYPAVEYITPESHAQKRELANYLESCYCNGLIFL